MVGLPLERGATPKERDRENTTHFPRGPKFPPQTKAGNYADVTFAARLKAGAGKDFADYTDSYAPNSVGTYDLGGNVWEWCEDIIPPGSADRVLRGGAWTVDYEGFARSSFRKPSVPTFRGRDYGFRIVLAPAASVPPAPK